MVSSHCAALQAMANSLEYSFFVCDTDLEGMYYPSDPFLKMANISKEKLEADPLCWVQGIRGERTALSSALNSLQSGAGGAKADVFFQSPQEEFVLVRLRFCGRCHEEGRSFLLGSAELLTDNIDYKQEVLKLRDHEIEISARIQRTLLTGEVSRSAPSYEIAAESLPSYKIDGDFYEFLSLDPDLIDFIIGDVMGKGVPAALLAAGVKSVFFKSFITGGAIMKSLPPIKDILKQMDDSINQDLIELGKFLTLCYCRLDLKKNLLHFIDAGHTGFIYYDHNEKSCWNVKGANMPLGFSPDQDFRSFLLPVRENDLLFFYSDGISEVKGREGDLFGLERIIRLVDSHHDLSPRELIKKVLNVAFFFSFKDIEDDVTAIAVNIKKDASPILSKKRFKFNHSDSVDLESIREEFSKDLQEVYPAQTEDVQLKLLIALMEALGNCVNHTRGIIEVSWRFYPLQAEVFLTFEGPGFDWFYRKAPSIDLYPHNGFGSYLIDEGTDSSLLLESLYDLKKIVLVKEMA